MKKIVLIILLLFSSLVSFAEDDNILCKFAIHDYIVLDREFNVINNMPSSNGNSLGLFILAESNSKKYIVVTLGKDPVYEIVVVNEVYGDIKNGSKIDMYQGGMTFQGQIVVINVFLEYDVDKNLNIPEAITIDVHKSPNFIQLKGLIPINTK